MAKVTGFSIRSQLLLIVLIAALPAASFIVSSGIDQRARAFRDAREDVGKLASIIASEQRYRVAAAQQLLMMLGQLPDVKDRRPDRVIPLLVAIHNLQTQYSNIFVADRSGRVWASALPSQNVRVADRRYFKNAMATQRLSSGEYIVSRFTKKLVIAFGYPYTDGRGNVAGVICLGFDLDFYKRLLSIDELKEGKSYLLLDHKGVVLARPINPGAFVGKAYNRGQFKRMQQGPDEDTVIEQGMDGRERLIAYRKMRLESEQMPYLYIRAAIPTSTILAHANHQLLVNAGLFVLFLLLALAAAWFIGKRSIADPVALLERVSRRMAEGDLQARVAGGIRSGELGSLGRTFDHMAEQLVARETERTKLIEDLQRALADIRTLQGILPICSNCKKIRNEDGDWTQLEAYISEHTNAEFSHGICAECAKKFYPNYLGRKE
jgi:HAMP domain-containing protein